MTDLPEIAEIRQRRKLLGLTQLQLAKRAQVSQSLVAKVEAGSVDPGYSLAKRLFSALEGELRAREASAKDVMQHPLRSVGVSDTLRTAVAKLRRHAISQMPVIKDGHAIGTITEAVLLDAMPRLTPTTPVSEVMLEPPPTVSPTTNTQVVAGLLRAYPLVLVMQAGRIRGIITRADLLERLPSRH